MERLDRLFLHCGIVVHFFPCRTDNIRQLLLQPGFDFNILPLLKSLTRKYISLIGHRSSIITISDAL